MTMLLKVVEPSAMKQSRRIISFIKGKSEAFLDLTSKFWTKNNFYFLSTTSNI